MTTPDEWAGADAVPAAAARELRALEDVLIAEYERQQKLTQIKGTGYGNTELTERFPALQGRRRS